MDSSTPRNSWDQPNPTATPTLLRAVPYPFRPRRRKAGRSRRQSCPAHHLRRDPQELLSRQLTQATARPLHRLRRRSRPWHPHFSRHPAKGGRFFPRRRPENRGPHPTYAFHQRTSVSGPTATQPRPIGSLSLPARDDPRRPAHLQPISSSPRRRPQQRVRHRNRSRPCQARLPSKARRPSSRRLGLANPSARLKERNSHSLRIQPIRFRNPVA